MSELAVKGALVSQDALENQDPGKPLQIVSHNLASLAMNTQGLSLDEREKAVLESASLTCFFGPVSHYAGTSFRGARQAQSFLKEGAQ